MIIQLHYNLILNSKKTDILQLYHLNFHIINSNYIMSAIEEVKDEAKECFSCTEKFTLKGLHARIKCGYCLFSACVECVETVLSGSMKDPECMNCHKTWSNEFMQVNFPKAVYDKKIKKHREDILFEREKSLLPATQAVIEIQKERYGVRDELKEQVNELYRRRREIDIQISDLNHRIRRINTNATNANDLESDVKTEDTKRSFVRACPADGCRGYLSTHFKCGLCEIWVCKECHEIKGEEKDSNHECKKENVESAKLLMAETKPCPKCNARIFKISGCDVMHCTMCHVSFSWKKGTIITNGNVHNPHYFEWQNQLRATGGRQQPLANGLPPPRDPRDMLCGGPDQDAIALVTKRFYHKKDRYGFHECPFNDIFRIYHEIVEMLPQFPTQHTINDHLDLRIRYLKGEMTEVSFKRTLQQREKKSLKNREEGDVWRTFVAVIEEELTRLSLRCNSADNKKLKKTDFDAILQQFFELRDYINNSFCGIKRRYNQKCRGLNIGWYLVDTSVLNGREQPVREPRRRLTPEEKEEARINREEAKANRAVLKAEREERIRLNKVENEEKKLQAKRKMPIKIRKKTIKDLDEDDTSDDSEEEKESDTESEEEEEESDDEKEYEI